MVIYFTDCYICIVKKRLPKRDGSIKRSNISHKHTRFDFQTLAFPCKGGGTHGFGCMLRWPADAKSIAPRSTTIMFGMDVAQSAARSEIRSPASMRQPYPCGVWRGDHPTVSLHSCSIHGASSHSRSGLYRVTTSCNCAAVKLRNRENLSLCKKKTNKQK